MKKEKTSNMKIHIIQLLSYNGEGELKDTKKKYCNWKALRSFITHTLTTLSSKSLHPLIKSLTSSSVQKCIDDIKSWMT